MTRGMLLVLVLFLSVWDCHRLRDCMCVVVVHVCAIARRQGERGLS